MWPSVLLAQRDNGFCGDAFVSVTGGPDGKLRKNAKTQKKCSAAVQLPADHRGEASAPGSCRPLRGNSICFSLPFRLVGIPVSQAGMRPAGPQISVNRCRPHNFELSTDLPAPLSVSDTGHCYKSGEHIRRTGRHHVQALKCDGPTAVRWTGRRL